MSSDVLIIGGGLAGLITATYLSQKGLKVLVIEKKGYPKHKVCGEYVSNEVLSFLNSLGFDPFTFGAKKIDKLVLSTKTGKTIESHLPLGGFSLSRYTLDEALAEKAKQSGAVILHDVVSAVNFNNELFQITSKTETRYTSKIVVGAYGKRSNLDKSLSRKFINQNSPYLAVKAHYRGDFPENLVALHNFNGGYCGLSKVENDHINACYITDYKSFKRYNDIEDFQRKVMYQNPFLKTFFDTAIPVFEKPMTISQIAFSTKELIKNHILMCGDSAGMIHPLCGNGMSMAIQSAQVLSSYIHDFFAGKIRSRSELESSYQKTWNQEFKSRLRTGRLLAKLFRMNAISEIMLSGLSMAPGTLSKIIERTHGKPLAIA